MTAYISCEWLIYNCIEYTINYRMLLYTFLFFRFLENSYKSIDKRIRCTMKFHRLLGWPSYWTEEFQRYESILGVFLTPADCEIQTEKWV